MGAVEALRTPLVAAAAVLSAWVAVAAPAMAQAQAADPLACPSASLGRASWNEKLTGLASARRAIERAKASTAAFATVAEDVAAARTDCENLVAQRANRANVPARQCVGDAAYLLGKHRAGETTQARDANFAAAYCSYVAAGSLAQGTGATEKTARAAALEGQGLALLGRAELGGANASRFQFAAVTALTAAADLAPTPQRLLALARAQAATGDLRAASASYDKLQSLPADAAAFPDKERVAALREQARLQQRDAAAFPAAGVRALWDRARKLEPSAETHFAYAKSLFDAGDVAAARVGFAEAAAAPNSGPTNYAGEAAYYLAVLDARNAATTAQWGEVLTNAQRAGPGDARFRRLSCMAYVARGGEPLAKEDGAAPCATEDTAEGQLLRGAYLLRRAQHLPTTCKPKVANCRQQYQANLEGQINGAIAAFQRGKALAPADAVFNWTEQPGTTEPKLKELLEFGETLGNSLLRIDGCRKFPTGPAASVALFKKLDLIGCTPTAR